MSVGTGEADDDTKTSLRSTVKGTATFLISGGPDENEGKTDSSSVCKDFITSETSCDNSTP